MNANRWVQIRGIVIVVALLATANVSQAALPVNAQTGGVPEALAGDDWATMQDLMREAQYQFTWQVHDDAWAYHAPNRAHDLSLSLSTDVSWPNNPSVPF